MKQSIISTCDRTLCELAALATAKHYTIDSDIYYLSACQLLTDMDWKDQPLNPITLNRFDSYIKQTHNNIK